MPKTQDKTRCLLFVDLGTRAGYAVADKALDKIWYGAIQCRPKEQDNKNHPGAPFDEFIGALSTIEKQRGPFTRIGYEQVYRWAGSHASWLYGGFRGILMHMAYMAEIPVEGVAVSTLKKHFTGNGRAGKNAIFDKLVAAGWDLPVGTPKKPLYDESDALAGLDWLLGQYGMGIGDFKTRKRVNYGE